MFPYSHYCYFTCAALYERLTFPLDADERRAILFILDTRMRRASDR